MPLGRRTSGCQHTVDCRIIGGERKRAPIYIHKLVDSLNLRSGRGVCLSIYLHRAGPNTICPIFAWVECTYTTTICAATRRQSTTVDGYIQ